MEVTMGIVVNRIDPSLVFEGVHAPDFPAGVWLSVDSLPPCDRKYYKITGDQVVEMTAAEKIIVDQAKAAQTDAAAWLELRSRRNSLLIACDWTQLADAPLTSQMKQCWMTYRQALRDLPSNTSNPSNPVWPTEPM